MKKIFNVVKEFIMITAATAIVAAAVFFFLIPSHVSVGSISGLAIVIGNFISLPISAITMILNVGLLIIGFLFIGREFGGKTVYTSILLPVIIGIFEKIFHSGGTLTIQLYLSATSEGDFETAFGIAFVLLIIVFLINIATKCLTRHFDATKRK